MIVVLKRMFASSIGENNQNIPSHRVLKQVRSTIKTLIWEFGQFCHGLFLQKINEMKKEKNNDLKVSDVKNIAIKFDLFYDNAYVQNLFNQYNIKYERNIAQQVAIRKLINAIDDEYSRQITAYLKEFDTKMDKLEKLVKRHTSKKKIYNKLVKILNVIFENDFFPDFAREHEKEVNDIIRRMGRTAGETAT